jgi:foldase protein PrsA
VKRTSRALAAAGLAVLLLAGCGEAQARAGAAATVGQESISTAELQQVVDRGLEDPAAQQQFGAAKGDYQRQVLNRLVRAQVLEQAAQDRGIEVTRGDVDAQLVAFQQQAGGREELEQQAAAGGIHPDDLSTFAREVAVEIALGDALTEDLDAPAEQVQALYDENIGQYDRVETRHILLADEAQARDLAAKVEADPATFAELAAEFSTDQSNAQQGGDLGFAGRGQFVPEFEAAVFGAQPGDVVVVQTQFGWHVVEVLDRQTTSLAEATPELRRSLFGEQRDQRVSEALREAADELGVEVNPRFGRWDSEAVEVVPVPQDDGLSSPAPEDGSSTGQAPAGQAPGGQAPGGQAPGGQAPQEQPAPAPTE